MWYSNDMDLERAAQDVGYVQLRLGSAQKRLAEMRESGAEDGAIRGQEHLIASIGAQLNEAYTHYVEILPYASDLYSMKGGQS